MAATLTDADALTARGRARLDAGRALLDRIVAARAPFTVANTLEPLNDIAFELTAARSEVGLLSQVHPDLAVRQAAEALERDLVTFSTELQQHRGLYDALGGIDPAKLDANAARVVTLTRDDMRRSGVELDEAGRSRIRALRDELAVIRQDFSRNTRDDVRSIALTGPEELAGLPEDYVRAHPPGPDGAIRITTNYPDVIPFMSYARSDRARRELAFVNANRCVPANIELLGRMLALREEQARLLGYATWAEYATADKMTGSAAAAREFIDRAAKATNESVAAELAELLARKRTDDPSATRIGSWEVAYYTERVKAERLAFDARSVRPYFEYTHVRATILELAADLFGLRFDPVSEPEAWHPAVETFEVTRDGRTLGRISLDMHPREGKYKHAACFGWKPGQRGRQLPHAVLVCNLPDPSASTRPALMDHSEVVTFFHEFGHLIHSIVAGQGHWLALTIPKEWDFIEAPSQFLEEWIYDAEVLRRVSKHVETGEPIPAETVARLRAARDFGRGVFVRRQLFFSAISLELHERDPRGPGGLDTTALVFELAARYSPTELLPGTHLEASFGHLEGYTALYYTYMWSLVIAKDLRSAFTRGLLDRETARRYVETVLAQGGTKPAAELVREFLGRPYGFEAFRAWLSPTPSTA